MNVDCRLEGSILACNICGDAGRAAVLARMFACRQAMG